MSEVTRRDAVKVAAAAGVVLAGAAAVSAQEKKDNPRPSAIEAKLLSEITSTDIHWTHTSEHNGIVAITTSNPDIFGWLYPKSELQRPIMFAIAALAKSQGKQVRVRYQSFNGQGFLGAEIIGIM